jgi:hypothetical protein
VTSVTGLSCAPESTPHPPPHTSASASSTYMSTTPLFSSMTMRVRESRSLSS